MATDLEVSVRRQLDRLRKELAAATGQVVALQDEIKRHELVYDMLNGRKTGKRSRRGRSGAGALKRGPRGAMIDWAAVFATLPDQFTLDSLLAHETAGEKPRGYLRQVVARWSKGAGSGAPAGAYTRRPDSEETGRSRQSRVSSRHLDRGRSRHDAEVINERKFLEEWDVRYTCRGTARKAYA